MGLKTAVPKVPRGVKPLNEFGKGVSQRFMWENLVYNLRLVVMVDKKIRIYQINRDGHSLTRLLFDQHLNLEDYEQLEPEREKEIENFALEALLYARAKKFAAKERAARYHYFIRERESKPQRNHRKIVPPQTQARFF